VVTSEMRELMIQLARVLLEETSAPPPPCKSTTMTIARTESGSAPLVPMPVTDIMEELTLQIVGQFFVTMRHYIELMLSERRPFEFV